MKARTNYKVTLREEIRETEGYRLTYTLHSEVSDKCASYGLTLYSVGITLEGNGKKNECHATDAFADRGRAVCFYNKLVEGLCTPTDLSYIIEDGIPE